MVLAASACTDREAERRAQEDALRKEPPVQTGNLNQAMGAGERIMPTLPTPQDRFVMAVRDGDRNEAERWLGRGATVDSGSVLVVAVRSPGDIGLVRWLAELGAPIEQPDLSGRTPLSWAAGKRRDDVAEYLLSRGGRVDTSDQLGRTPLHYAVFGADTSLVEILIEAGANVDAQDGLGTTPLMYACAKSLPEVVETLDRAGARWDARDTLGRTAAERVHDSSGICLRAPETQEP